jgi:ABC-type amino acid transport system permease subunit
MVYSVVLLTYFVICSCISQLSRHLERRFRASAWVAKPVAIPLE